MNIRLVGGIATEAAIVLMLVYGVICVLILIAICLAPNSGEIE